VTGYLSTLPALNYNFFIKVRCTTTKGQQI